MTPIAKVSCHLWMSGNVQAETSAWLSEAGVAAAAPCDDDRIRQSPWLHHPIAGHRPSQLAPRPRQPAEVSQEPFDGA